MDFEKNKSYRFTEYGLQRYLSLDTDKINYILASHFSDSVWTVTSLKTYDIISSKVIEVIINDSGDKINCKFFDEGLDALFLSSELKNGIIEEVEVDKNKQNLDDLYVGIDNINNIIGPCKKSELLKIINSKYKPANEDYCIRLFKYDSSLKSKIVMIEEK